MRFLILRENKFLLFEATKFVAICYNCKNLIKFFFFFPSESIKILENLSCTFLETFLVGWSVRNVPAMQETRVQPLS